MGLLDDAIREHLDLKRQHGADPSDVAKLERDAFGPVRRDDAEVAEAAPEPGEPQSAWEPEADAAPAGGSVALDDAPEAPAPPETFAPSAEPSAYPPPHHEPLPVETDFEDVGEPTVEYEVAAGEPDPQPDAEPADELEETPEFLEETPEHDRLWFEQKPPRDFDF